MMRKLDTFGYFEDREVQVLRLPYQGNSLAMLVLLPTKIDGLAGLERSLTADKLWAWASKASDQKVHVMLPRWKMNDAFELQPALAQLGMKSAFEPVSADLRGMDGGRDRLYIDRVIHKSFVEVNEKGTEAAAATAVIPVPGAAPGFHNPPPIPVFRADHPFAFAIYDMHSGMVLFLGRVVAP